MPRVTAADEIALDRALDALCQADPAQRPAALRRIFVQRLDFEPAAGDVPLQHTDLPPSAQRIATRDGVEVVLVQLPATGRLTAKSLTEALKGIRRTLSEVFLVATNAGGSEWQFVYPTLRGGRDVLRRMAVQRGQPRRTVVEQLMGIYRKAQSGDLRAALERAYDVEAVTARFFQEYRRIFEQVRGSVSGLPDPEERWLFCQTLFNRLMFLYFLQRKGWLTFGGNPDYLNALWESYTGGPAPSGAWQGTGPEGPSSASGSGSFYTARLKLLFFTALNNPRSQDFRLDYADELVGSVPFLNGGLFAEEELDRRPGVGVPDTAIEMILRDLLARFNFTITESTPYDVEVAVDPEMLGKVFEELVTGRHETGSYYTPRPVVAFMCCEALKGYLAAQVEGLEPAVVAAVVDEHEIGGMTMTQAGAVLDALERITVVDPACGSGAYLLGMLHELVELQKLLYNSALIAGAKELYELKLRVIERNVYGVDIDRFAVNIAMLRLWLSLVVDYEGDDPPPLPNLDYKIAHGDSLSAPNPQGTTDLIQHTAGAMAAALARLKGEYMRATGEEKRPLHDEIAERQAELRAMLAHAALPDGAVDWRVQFAEVFERGGFDVVLANPPYVRQELIKDQKPAFKTVYGDLYSGTADLYVYFYYRALQLLKSGGMIVFISSNKWFRANYGAKLRKHIADTCHVFSITDFGDLPVFESATAYPMIFIAQRDSPLAGPILLTEVESLDPPYPDVLAVIQRDRQLLPPDAISGGSWLLTDANVASNIQTMIVSSVPLAEYVGGKIYYGVKTGLNRAFIIDKKKKEELIAQDAGSKEVIKPLVFGKDVRRWYVGENDKWLIFTRRGVNIDDYFAIRAHLSQWHAQLEPKPRDWSENKKWLGRKAGSYKWFEIQDEVAYYSAFSQDKIIFPDIAKAARFAIDTAGTYPDCTLFIMPVNDLYLLGVLNSKAVEGFYIELSAQVRGGYLRFKRQYVERIPIPAASPADRVAIADLVQKCLDAKGQGPDVAAWEAEIDARVARLYGLSAAEAATIAGATADGAAEGDETATA